MPLLQLFFLWWLFVVVINTTDAAVVAAVAANFVVGVAIAVVFTVAVVWLLLSLLF